MSSDFKNVEEYIGLKEEKTKLMLEQLRKIITDNAPEVSESISYGMPAYKTFGKPLVYFAAFSKHIGLYATPSGHEAFKKELSIYKQGKGSVQFPINTPLPYDLITKIIKFRVEENRVKYSGKT